MCTKMRRGVTPVSPCQQRYRDVQGATHEVDRLRGDDFSEICSTEVIERAASPIIEEAMAVPGRAVALLVSGYMLPVDVRVRLFMDMGHNPGFTGMARILGTLRRWLSWPGGGNLVLPDDPEIEYRDAILVGASDWSDLFEAGECTLAFTLFDPIGWSARRALRWAATGRRCRSFVWREPQDPTCRSRFPRWQGYPLGPRLHGRRNRGDRLPGRDATDQRRWHAGLRGAGERLLRAELGDCIASTSNCTHPVSSPRSTSVASTSRRSRTCSTRSRDART